MQSISRRGFVISAATAGAVFGLNKPLEFVAPALAQAPNAAQAEKGFVKFKVGDIQVTQIYDGIWEKAHDPGFIKNATVDDTKAALKSAGQTEEFVPVTFTITVVEVGGKTIMFDSGTGGGQAGGPKAGLLAKQNMAKAGIDASKVSTIMVTHFHGDHISGLMAKDTNAAIFPNAEIIVSEAEYKFWTDPATLEKLPPAAQGLAKRIQAVFPTWKNIKQVGYDKDVGSGIRSVNSNGHTPGHTSYLMGSAGSQLLVSGDITNIPALNLKNPGWHLVFDANAALAEENRRKTFERAIADKMIVTGYHFGMPGAGTIVKDGNGYAYVPVTAA
jgi:glyoxylase-like metal-dependent hydrolase (beta-lactamase superfamily II)